MSVTVFSLNLLFILTNFYAFIISPCMCPIVCISGLNLTHIVLIFLVQGFEKGNILAQFIFLCPAIGHMSLARRKIGYYWDRITLGWTSSVQWEDLKFIRYKTLLTRQQDTLGLAIMSLWANRYSWISCVHPDILNYFHLPKGAVTFFLGLCRCWFSHFHFCTDLELCPNK